MTTLERALSSIGKKCFVDYFDDFKTCNDKAALARKLLTTNSNATSITAQMTRINYARWIFDTHQEKEALYIIITSNRLDDVTKRKAAALFDLL
ncbi:MAG: hypothetical protein E7503_00780 [Ruminococcus sp.]|nr:hypothetical protein [Ruminococcus sp.]